MTKKSFACVALVRSSWQREYLWSTVGWIRGQGTHWYREPTVFGNWRAALQAICVAIRTDQCSRSVFPAPLGTRSVSGNLRDVHTGVWQVTSLETQWHEEKSKTLLSPPHKWQLGKKKKRLPRQHCLGCVKAQTWLENLYLPSLSNNKKGKSGHNTLEPNIGPTNNNTCQAARG